MLYKQLEKVLEKEEQLMKLAYNSVRQRTAGALIRLHEKFTGEAGGAQELNVSREELANMVGTGVFTSLGFQLMDIDAAPIILFLWVIGGVLALCGALCYAELGAALP